MTPTQPPRRLAHIDYRWIALSNTTLGVLMAGLNGSVVMIALPAIFRGIGVDPLGPGESDYLLWTLMGYTLVTATILVSAGRISDMYGRVRLYNAGFAIFTAGSVLCFFVQGQGNGAALELIVFRLVQAAGGAFLFANSAAILTDAFPPDQRGLAMGINQIGMLAGTFFGLLLGGVLAAIDWRAIFLVSVPFGLFGTVWAYLMLHETATIRKHQRLDIPGNILFAVGLTLVLIGFTYAIQPYGQSSMGWGNPWVIGELASGVALLGVFVFVEGRVADPMFRLELFRIRMFAAGNIAGFLSSLARGGLQLILIVWLQGIWLPLHGYAFEDAPLWAGIYMLPMTLGFFVAGPLSGMLSDRYGARYFSTGGMLISAAAFVGFLALPADFEYAPFALLMLMLGIGQGAFASPNTASIMNAVPPEHRGASSGMRATFQNVASSLSMTLIFTLVIAGLSSSLPRAMYGHLTAAGIPTPLATQLSGIPPMSALFAAFLGYNPMATLIPGSVLAGLPSATRSTILGTSFFPQLLSGPFHDGLQIVFSVCVVLSLGAAAASWLRGRRYIHDYEVGQAEPEAPLRAATAASSPSASLLPASLLPASPLPVSSLPASQPQSAADPPASSA
ncbi:MAG: MFS transporter [Candidatus Limnocylindrales bacterium]|jgi:MFS family permease